MNDFQVMLTVSGNENRYAEYIYNSYKHIKQIKFLGIQSVDKVNEFYNMSSCVIFPSKLETWGLPITEAKSFSKPILLADLEYAHETIGNYDKVKFFDPNEAVQLAAIMKDVINESVVFQTTEMSPIDLPFTQNWGQLFDVLLKD